MGGRLSGETNLRKLLGSMRPNLRTGGVRLRRPCRTTSRPTSTHRWCFARARALTLIVSEEAARKAGLAAIFPCRRVTLDIHSSLDAVGFMAAITTRLAASGIGVNPVSAYFHDHLFVPAERADEAVAILEQLAAEARG